MTDSPTQPDERHLVSELDERFGLRWVPYRIGEHELRFAEVAEVDRCVRELYPHCLVDHGAAPVWMISWPAAFGLAEYLVHERGVGGLEILELGCGTAVPGVTAACAGAQVLATDYDPYALAVAGENARVNGCAEGFTRGTIDWYETELERRFPLVIGAEITYHEQAFEPLSRVLEAAVAPGGTVLLSDIYRKQTDAFVDRLRAAGWRSEQHPRQVHLAAASHAIRVIELTRKP